MLHSVCFYFLMALTTLPALSPLSAQQAVNNWQEELRQLNTELEQLQNELKKKRHEALNAEMHAQPQMFDNFHQYAKDIQANEGDEESIIKIKNRLSKLQARKNEILQAHPQ